MPHCVVYALIIPAAALAQPRSTERAESSPGATARPKMVVRTNKVDVGTVRQGAVKRVALPVENHGTAPLRILSVTADCACTVAEYPKSIAPGRGGTVWISFNAKGRTGQQRSKITILSDDPLMPRMDVEVTASIEQFIQVSPLVVRFNAARRGEPIVPHVTVMPFAQPGSLRIDRVVIKRDKSALTYRIEPRRIGDRRGAEVIFGVAKNAKPQRLAAAAVFDVTIGKRHEQVGVAITGIIFGQLVVKPLRLERFKTQVAPGEKIGTVTVTTTEAKPFRLLHVRTGPNLTSEVRRVAEGLSYEIDVALAEGRSAGPFGDFVDIWTNAAARPAYRVPVYAEAVAAVQAEPSLLLLRRGKKPQHTGIANVQLHNREPGEWAVTEIRSDNPYFTAAVVDNDTAGNQRSKTIRVTLGEDTPPGDHHALIEVINSATDPYPVQIAAVAVVAAP